MLFNDARSVGDERRGQGHAQFFGDAEVHHDIGAFGDAGRDLPRMLAAQNARDKLGGLAADLVIIKADRDHRSGVDIRGLGGEDRRFGIVCAVHESVNGRSDGVVGQAVNDIGFGGDDLRGLADFDAFGRRAFDDFHPARGGGFFEQINQRNGVGLARVVYDADGFRGGQHFADDIDMLADRRKIGKPGHIAAGVFHRGDEFRADGVGDGGENHRNVFGGGGERLRAGRGDSDQHIGIFAHELARDLGGDGGLPLRGLEFKSQVVAFAKAGVIQPRQQPFAAGIERGMLDDLRNGDDDIFGGGVLRRDNGASGQKRGGARGDAARMGLRHCLFSSG